MHGRQTGGTISTAVDETDVPVSRGVDLASIGSIFMSVPELPTSSINSMFTSTRRVVTDGIADGKNDRFDVEQLFRNVCCDPFTVKWIAAAP